MSYDYDCGYGFDCGCGEYSCFDCGYGFDSCLVVGGDVACLILERERGGIGSLRARGTGCESLCLSLRVLLGLELGWCRGVWCLRRSGEGEGEGEGESAELGV